MEDGMRKMNWIVGGILAGLTLGTLALPGIAEANGKRPDAKMDMKMDAKVDAKANSQTAGKDVYMWPVAKDQICMVQKYDMEAKTTPVVLDGKTYWVCCEGCKNQITKDKNERVIADPVSGKVVNKADAVVGRASNGQVHFFENEKNMAAFRPTFTPVPPKD